MSTYAPTRRAVLGGRLTPTQAAVADDAMLHISSAVVTVLPAHREAIIGKLSGLADAEVHHAEAFKIVVVLEATDPGAIGIRLAEIATWEGVLSANMVFEQTERLAEIGD
jgi:periplasmic nitrate reductase NapD